MDANLAIVIAEQDAGILPRRSYENWARHWTSSDFEPCATFINRVAKYVASSTRPSIGAGKLDDNLTEFVRDLKKKQPGSIIGVHASTSVAQALLAAGVVDELRLVIAPMIAGRGQTLIQAASPPTQLPPWPL
jgi:dihydrofolate reductase